MEIFHSRLLKLSSFLPSRQIIFSIQSNTKIYNSKKLVVTGETLAEALLARQNSAGGATKCAMATGVEQAVDCSGARMDGKKAKKIIVPASTKVDIVTYFPS